MRKGPFVGDIYCYFFHTTINYTGVFGLWQWTENL